MKYLTSPSQEVRSTSVRVFVAIVVGIFLVGNALGEEPAQKFLQALADKGYLKLSVVYLEDLKSRNVLDSLGRAALDLEVGIIDLQTALSLPATSPEREAKFKSAETALNDFIQKNPQHPRRSEARLKLGEILLTLADATVRKDQVDARNEAAIAAYDKAQKFYQETFQELSNELAKIRGARVDNANTKELERRNQLQSDVRQAQIFAAKCLQDRGIAQGKENANYKKDLLAAKDLFSTIISEEQRLLGIRNYALYYRSQIYRRLNEIADAIDGMQRVVDTEEGSDVLRPLQNQAMSELMELLVIEGKPTSAISRGEEWLNGLGAGEMTTSEAIQFRIALDKVRINYAKQLESEKGEQRTISQTKKNARNDLMALIALPGPHRDEAQKLLGELGVGTESTESTELPDVANYEQAIEEARIRLERSEAEQALADGLQKQVDAGDKSVAVELDSLNNSVRDSRLQALVLLQKSLAFPPAKVDVASLFETRFRIAYVLLKLDRPLEAVSVADFLARSNPGTSDGLRAASIALAGFGKLLDNSSLSKATVAQMLEPIARYMVEQWPSSPDAAAAASILAQIALKNGDIQGAEAFLKLLPGGSPIVSKLRRDIGLSFMFDYSRLQRLASSEPTPEQTAELSSLKEKATLWLEQAAETTATAEMDEGLATAIVSLAKLKIDSGDNDRAAQLLLDPTNGLTAKLVTSPSPIPTRVKLDVYRTSIQVVAAKVVGGSQDANAAAAQMSDLVAKLQAAGDANDDDRQLLTSVFVSLARDLKQSLQEIEQPDRKAGFAQVVALVVREAAKSESFATQFWAANTLATLAEDMQLSSRSSKSNSEIYQQLKQVVEAMLQREKSSPGWIQPASAVVQLQMFSARADKALGNYQEAVRVLGEILDKNAGLLDIQVEAARTLQAWGGEKPGFYRLAILGGRHNADTGQNAIWGWGKIAQVTANKADFAEQFFDARYQLAKCRFLYAKSLAGEEQKSEMEKATRDITSTEALYPALGGNDMRKRYDTLLREIQKELGAAQTGLTSAEN